MIVMIMMMIMIWCNRKFVVYIDGRYDDDFEMMIRGVL